MTLRWFSKIFFQILDIATLSIFLLMLDCPTWSRPEPMLGHNSLFNDQCKAQRRQRAAHSGGSPSPGSLLSVPLTPPHSLCADCWGMPYTIHFVVGVLSALCFTILACAFTVGEMELDFTTKNKIAMMHTG